MTVHTRQVMLEAAELIGRAGAVVFDSSAVASMLLDVSARQILHVNDACVRTLGLPRDEIVGRPAADFLQEPTHDEVLRTRALGRERTETVRVIVGATGPRTVELNVVPTRVENVVFVQAIDVTDELRLLEVDSPADAGRRGPSGLTARQHDAILGASPVPTFVLDLGIRAVVHANAAASALLGRPVDDIVGRPGRVFLIDPAAGDVLRREALRSRGQAAALRTDVASADGPRPATVALSMVPASTLAVAQVVDIVPAAAAAPHHGPAGAAEEAAAPGEEGTPSRTDTAPSGPDRERRVARVAAPVAASVLLVDPDPDVRLLSATRLRDRGYVVEDVGQLHEALSLLEADDDLFDVVVIDPNRSGHHGSHAVEMVAGATSTPIVVHADAPEIDLRRTLRQGAAATVSKLDPDPGRLVDAVVDVIDPADGPGTAHRNRRASEPQTLSETCGRLIALLPDTTDVDTWVVVRGTGDERRVLAVAGPTDLAEGDELVEADPIRHLIDAHHDLRVVIDGRAEGALTGTVDPGVGTYVGVPLAVDGDDAGGMLCGIQAEAHSDPARLASLEPMICAVAEGLAVAIGLDDERTRLGRRLDLAETAALHDGLTGLGNQRAWAQALRRRAALGVHASIVVIDLDGLKLLNDTEGHGAGDFLIRRSSAALDGSLRASDTAFRVGGDEFCILLDETSPDGVDAILRRLRAALDNADIDASIGGATQTDDSTLEETWERADVQMRDDKVRRRLAR